MSSERNFFVFQDKNGTHTGHANIVWCLSIEEKSTYSHFNLVFVAKISDGKIFNGFSDNSLKYKNQELLEVQLGTC